MPGIVVGMAQVKTAIGDFAGNTHKIGEYIARAADAGAEVILFPEMTITGYPPGDLLLNREFVQESAEAIRKVARDVGEIVAIVGCVEAGNGCHNAAAIMTRGEIIAVHHKAVLGISGLFEEQRYFLEGTRFTRLEMLGTTVGITIGEELEQVGKKPLTPVPGPRAELLLNLSARPFYQGSFTERKRIVEASGNEQQAVIACANAVGAQDGLIFDGGSCLFHPREGFLAQAARFEERMIIQEVEVGPENRGAPHHLRPSNGWAAARDKARPSPAAAPAGPSRQPSIIVPTADIRELSSVEEIYEALIMGLGEYVRANRFGEVVLGLSGGIDSALVAALAAGAIGGENVRCVFMPSMHTSGISADLAERCAASLCAHLMTIPIEEIYDAFLERLSIAIDSEGQGQTFENLQARIRGTLLMALSNRFGWLLLAPGNKSELSMGYCTMYGDMAGGLAPLKDLYKTQVYELSEYINERAGMEMIPAGIIERAPTAELRPGQLDTDSLPPYGALDPILKSYIEENLGPAEIVKRGFDEAVVRSVLSRVDANEHKRRQAPPGIKLSKRSFDGDWRMPISTFKG